jgi:16S rRNA (uracil1498-N3)-methyltransferase
MTASDQGAAPRIRLFVDIALQAGSEPDLPPDAARHAQVRRVQPGDLLWLFDGTGSDWPATVLAMGRQEVRVRIGQPQPVDRELRRPVLLAVGMPANDRMDLLVEKATELGVDAIQPLHCERSVLRLAGDRAQRKRAHWQAVAIAACEQCGRSRVPQVRPVADLLDWLRSLEHLKPDRRWLLASPTGAAAGPHVASSIAPPGMGEGLITLSGPEGGFSPAEIDAAAASGFMAISLGRRVLRADTAPLAALAWIAALDEATLRAG